MPTDLRVIKTHNAIRNALITLLEHKNFSEISVQDIVDTALVNRATFYKYYSGKSDLAGKMIADFKQSYAELLNERHNCLDFNVFCNQALQAFAKDSRVMLALWKIQTPRHHLYRDMFLMLKQSFGQFADEFGGVSDYQAEMFALLSMQSMKYYFERGETLDAQSMIEAMKQTFYIAEQPMKKR